MFGIGLVIGYVLGGIVVLLLEAILMAIDDKDDD